MRTKEHPLLMHGVEVRAILEGRMSQFRRVMKPQPEQHYIAGYGIGRSGYPDEWTPTAVIVQERDWRAWAEKAALHCPFGGVGTRLWVKETLKIHHPSEAHYAVDGARVDQDETRFEWRDVKDKWANGVRTLPSVQMPRWASRLTLEVKEVWPERLQSISYEDIFNAGAPVEGQRPSEARLTLAALWDEMNPKHPWSSDPWAWRVAFRRV